MTRDEYRKKIADRNFGAGWEFVGQSMNFVGLLKDVATELFIRKDLYSDLAVETRRRLEQLRQTGETD